MVHLHVHSWYSFLSAASPPTALAESAAHSGQSALACTDDWTLAGNVQHALACQKNGIKPIHGARVSIDGVGLVLLACDIEGYANLCDLLTRAHHDRLNPTLTWDDLQEQAGQGHTASLICLSDVRDLIVGERFSELARAILRLRESFPNRLFIELIHHAREGDAWLNARLQQFAHELQLRCVATNAVRHNRLRDYMLYDALVCAKHGITVEQGHPLRPVNDAAFLCRENYFSWTNIPRSALANSEAIARDCSVDLLSPEVTPPHATVPPGMHPREYLRQLCADGFRRRYPGGSKAAQDQLEKELKIIGGLELDEFFLVVAEVVRFARSRNIRCSGRGSAANSIVAYLLNITEVDPIRHKLLFERFLHEGRRGMPDIDVDFPSDRREEVIAWMHDRWGEEHTAMTANLVTFRLRLAVREMAKVLGFPLHKIDRATKLLPPGNANQVREHRAELAEALGDSPALDVLCSLVARLHECPRHLSLHSGGMILSRQALRYLSPIQTSANGVRQIQFPKDDVERLGLIKFDVLALRMLSVISEAQSLIDSLHDGEDTAEETPFNVDAIPDGDPATYELIRSAETLGVFQIESPGQWNLLSRTQPKTFDDLVIQVALFRPGPIQGGMVHPFIARLRGVAKTHYPHPCLEPVLHDTHGIILFQEQVLEVAHVFAGLSLSEADDFRKLMSKFRSPDEMEGMRSKFVDGAITTHAGSRHPVHPALANRVFDMVSHFVGYGFCRSHAAAFARTVYQSAYLKAHYMAAYMAAVMEHEPGFFPKQSFVEEARRNGVPVLPVSLLRSEVKYSLEYDSDGSLAIRIPFTQVDGFSAETAAEIVLQRALGPFKSLEDAVERLPLSIDDWENLARSGAVDLFGARRKVLWQVRSLVRDRQVRDRQVRDRTRSRKGARHLSQQLRLDVPHAPPPPAVLWSLEIQELLRWDFETQNISSLPHPISLHRTTLDRLGAVPTVELRRLAEGSVVRVAGTVISRMRPPTAKGMCFIVLEDETGRVPTAITPDVYQQFSRALRSPGLVVEGTLETGGVLSGDRYRSVLIDRLWPIEAVCRRVVNSGQATREDTAKVITGAAGHPGENPRQRYALRIAGDVAQSDAGQSDANQSDASQCVAAEYDRITESEAILLQRR